MEIRVDDVSNPQVLSLLREHLESARLHSPPESIHALDVDLLRGPDVVLWSVWEKEELLGFGALKQLDQSHGEIKSMRTAPAHLRRGIAAALLRHIMEEARRRSYRRLSLETGSMQAFEPARRLYASFGFELCGPFGKYVEDPNTVFMTREL
jgi:putative acetyltransferase